MQLVVAIADAVTSHLAGGTYTTPIQPARLFRPIAKAEELTTPKVSVVPKAVDEIAQASRVQNQFTVSIDIAVQRKLTAADDAEVLPLFALVSQIVDRLRNQSFEIVDPGPIGGAMVRVYWLRIANSPLFIPEHWDQQRIFTGLLTSTYRVMR